MYAVSNNKAPYLEEVVIVRHEEESGKLCLPVAYSAVGVTPNAVAVQVCKPQCCRVVAFKATRLKLPPDLPEAFKAETDEVELFRAIEPMDVAEDIRRTPMYTLVAVIVFQRLNGKPSPKYPACNTFVNQNLPSITTDPALLGVTIG